MGNSKLLTRQIELNEKENVKLKINASDVSLSLNANAQSSILNIVPAIIREIDLSADRSKAVVKLEIENQFILAHITPFSVKNLELKINQEIYAQIKSVAMLR